LIDSYFSKSNSLYVYMDALDSFISPVARFEGDHPIPVILVLAWSPSGESASDPSAGANAEALRRENTKRLSTRCPRRKPRRP
jgi:hypothetical protein